MACNPFIIHMPYSWAHWQLAFCVCRGGVGRRKVLWNLSLPLHEWHAAFGSCIFLVQGMQPALSLHVHCNHPIAHALHRESCHMRQWT